MYEMTQGDSFSIKISSPIISTFDTNWVGTWGIVTEPGTPALISGTLSRSSDTKYMIAKVPPSESIKLAEDLYYLVATVSNPVEQFSREAVRTPIKVIKKGML